MSASSTTAATYQTLTLAHDSVLYLTVSVPSRSYLSYERAWISIIDQNKAMTGDGIYDNTWWFANDNGESVGPYPLQAGVYTIRLQDVVAQDVSGTLTINYVEAANDDTGEGNGTSATATTLTTGSAAAATIGYRRVDTTSSSTPIADPKTTDYYTFTPPSDGTVSYSITVKDIGLPSANSNIHSYIYGSNYSDITGLTFNTTGTQTSGTASVYAGTRYLLIVGANYGAYGSYDISYSFTSSSASTCSASYLESCTSSTQCTQYGGYWVSSVSHCYDSTACLAGYVSYCGYESWCTQAGYYWYNDQCNTQPSSNTCTSSTLSQCTSMDACTAAHGYWNFDWCGATPQSDASHYDTYCQQGYTQYCSGSETTLSDWIPRTDIKYQSIATYVSDSTGYRLNGGSWSNSRPNSAGEYDGNGVQSRASYDFAGKTIYGTFTAHGAGSYAAWYFKPWYLPLHHMNTNHSYGGGILIPDDTKIYATMTIGAGGNWSSVLASGNYQHLGGTTINSESGTLSSTQLTQLASSPFLVSFGDNYGGTGTYMQIHEVRIADSGTTDVTTGNSDCLFGWAEQHYSSLFAPSGASSGTLGDYYYRYYSRTSAYLATNGSDSHLYYLGPATGNVITDLGVASAWLSLAGCR